jgi:RNA polymerase sigma-32 factor
MVTAMVERSGRSRAAKPARKAPAADAPEANAPRVTPGSPSPATPATPRRSGKRGGRGAAADGARDEAKAGADADADGDGGAREAAVDEHDDAEGHEEDGDGVDEGLVGDGGSVIDLAAGDDDEPVAEAEVIDGDVGPGDELDGEHEADDVLGDGGRPARRKRERDEGRVGLIKRDPMQAYMQEVRRYPLLTPEEERSLATRLVEHGDTAAARRLVEANLRLVVKIAYEYRRAHRNLLDLVQEGNIGLIQAVGKFDPDRGVKLSSYAAFWIRAYILKFILNNWRLVKIGTTQAQRKLFFNLRKERERLEQLGFYPSAKLLAEHLDVSEKEVVEMEKRLAAPEASLDAPVPGDEDGARTRLDFVPSEEARPDQAVEDNEFFTRVREAMTEFAATLSGREADIFAGRFKDPPMTLQELGDKYGISRERARQLEKRMLERAKKFLEARGIDVTAVGLLARD